MKIRLVMPICSKLVDSKEKYYCIESANNRKYRFKILENAMIFNAKKIDLVVTSNNYFYFNINNEKIVILSQQFPNSIQIPSNKRVIINKKNKLNQTYFSANQLHYKYVFPKTLMQEVYMFNDKHNLTKEFENIKYFFVDIEI